ncbi:MAG: thymidylate kinase [bacterium]
MPRGKLIVIEGTDGSGKATQSALLVQRLLRQPETKVETIAFPRYETPTGRVVRAYLDGQFGPASEVDAKTASLLYMADRWAATPMMERWLNAGAVVVADRFVASNMGHQGGKISSPEERAELFRWLHDQEHIISGIPEPDLNVLLHVPAEICQRLAVARSQGKELDQHEGNIEHLRAAEEAYLQMAEMFPNCHLIECTRDGRLMTPEEIHELVWQEVQPVLQSAPTAQAVPA